LSSCSNTSPYKKAQFDEDIPELNVYGILEKDFSSKYFGGFRFLFENKSDKWLTIDNISLTFPDKNAQKYIQILDEEALKIWGRAMRSRIQILLI
jgi:hypothetical protein